MPHLEEGKRKRKAHHKSRRGCGNCKLRRVKCDETKPNCQKCLAFGVACDYESKETELQFAGVGVFQVDIPHGDIPPPIDETINGMMNYPLDLFVEAGSTGSSVCYIDEPHLDLLRKFQRRTVFTLGTAGTRALYREHMVRMASQHSVLLHAILRITLMHDRYIYDPIDAKPSAAEAFHGYHGAALFSQKLLAPLAESEKDALWATAAIIGACSFASLDATGFQDAWPLEGAGDLDWIRMSEGKREVWRLADPLREGSVWREPFMREQSKTHPKILQPLRPELDRLFPYVTKLYNLDSARPDAAAGATVKDPYHTAASIVERLVPIDCNDSTIMWFLSFIGHMDAEYRALLEQKDPPALILLAWWYAKMIPYGGWWLARRGLFECQAICVYLDRALASDSPWRPLLEFPKLACGFLPASSSPLQGSNEEEVPAGDGEWLWARNY